MATVTRPPGVVVRRSSPLPLDQREAERSKKQMMIRQRQVLQTLYTLLFTPSPAISPSILPQFISNQHFPSGDRVTEILDETRPTFPQVEPSDVAKPRAADDLESTGSETSSFGFDEPFLRGTRATRKDATALKHEAYDQYLAEIDQLFDPLTRESDHSDGFVFLCWGNAMSCRVQGVKHFQHDMDHELFWKKLQTAWFQVRGQWRRNVPWYGIRNVKVVDVRLVGPVLNSPEQFYATYQLLDELLEKEKKRNMQVIEKFQSEDDRKLREKRIKAYKRYSNRQGDCDDYNDDHGFDLDECIYDQKLNRTNHSDRCSWMSKDPSSKICEVEEQYQSRDMLNGLMMEPMRTLLFQNPKLAVHNKLLNRGLVNLKSDVTYQYQNGHCRGIGQFTFPALLIEDGWMFDASVGVIYMPLAGIVALSIVLLAWVIYRDWGIAWNVGSCIMPLLVALASTLLQTRAFAG